MLEKNSLKYNTNSKIRYFSENIKVGRQGSYVIK